MLLWHFFGMFPCLFFCVLVSLKYSCHTHWARHQGTLLLCETIFLDHSERIFVWKFLDCVDVTFLELDDFLQAVAPAFLGFLWHFL